MNKDWHAALNHVASTALLESVTHQRDKTPVDNDAIQESIVEALALIHSDIETGTKP